MLGLLDVHCIDTYFYEDMDAEDPLFWQSRNPKKLKDLASIHLNAQIQEDVHSSVSSASGVHLLNHDVDSVDY